MEQKAIAIARNKEKLQRSLDFGAYALSTDKSVKEIRDESDHTARKGPTYGWKFFEFTAPKWARNCPELSFVGKMMVVGYGMQKVEYMLSRLMAFDAEIIGTWAARPTYPEVLQMVLKGKSRLNLC